MGFEIVTGLRIGIVGAGLIGRKRAASLDHDDVLVGIYDRNLMLSESLSAELKTASFGSTNELVSEVGEGGLVVIATLHDGLVREALAAVEHGCHVLVEKPGARGADEFKQLINLAQQKGVKVRVGFNHRFHPGILEMKNVIDSKEFGDVQLVRARYGHGGREGYEKEWRANRQLSGGGELLDQGSHLIDLARFMAGDIEIEFSSLPTIYWDMEVEDNAFMFGKLSNGSPALLHASWTEWKNIFSFEVFLKTAKLEVNGLGGSYGPESFTKHHMKSGLGPPESTTIQYPPGDDSWKLELEDVRKTINGLPHLGADDSDAMANLLQIEKMYKNDNF